MVSKKLKALRKKVQGTTDRVRSKKEAARKRREQAKFRKELRMSRVRESGAVQEAKATKRELDRLSSDVGELATEVTGSVGVGSRTSGAVKSAKDAGKSVSAAAKGTDSRLKKARQIESQTLEQASIDANLDVAAGRNLETAPEAGVGRDGLFGRGDPDLTDEMDQIDDDLLE